jgi:hypothetical protein
MSKFDFRTKKVKDNNLSELELISHSHNLNFNRQQKNGAKKKIIVVIIGIFGILILLILGMISHDNCSFFHIKCVTNNTVIRAQSRNLFVVAT